MQRRGEPFSTAEPLGARWAIVLAAGEGRRLAGLTRALYGEEIPKQFANFANCQSLLQITLARIRGLIAETRTVVVVAAGQETLAKQQLAGFPGAEIVAQPRNLGTGPGILLPLCRVLARDPLARVTIFPSDHFLTRPRRFLRVVRNALRVSESSPSGVVLVGAAAENEEPEYGWILPGEQVLDAARLGGRLVQRFVEKPDPELARALFRLGALWNTFVSAGSALAYQRLFVTHLPQHAVAFAEYARHIGTPSEPHRLQALYDCLPPADFSEAILPKESGLAVVRMSASGWSDWGSPHRVFRSLASSSALPALLARLEGKSEAAPLLRMGKTYMDSPRDRRPLSPLFALPHATPRTPNG